MTQSPLTSPVISWTAPHPALDGIALIDHLYNRLDGLYPHRWRSAFAGPDSVANWRASWAEGLAEDRITLDEVRRGLAVCRQMYDWPPSYAEFLRACRPSPDYEAAFCEAVEQMHRRATGEDRWSAPAVYWAATRLGADLSTHPYASIKGRWRAALDGAIADIRAGKLPAAVPQHRAALPAPGRRVTPPETARQHLARIRAMLAAGMRR